MKLYDVSIDLTDRETGLNAISLVEYPAVEVDFLAFSKDEHLPLQFADDEKHIITGVAILADTPIYRCSADGEEYYVRFTKETIKQLVEKYFKLGFSNNVNIEHNDDQFVDGVNLIESYIIDKERGICPKEFSAAPDGSWITSYKVSNLDVWDKIKNGEVKGFSVQGFFNLIESKLDFNNDKKQNKLNFMSKLRTILENFLLQFGEVKTDKGVIEYEATEIAIDVEVMIDGKPAEDGEYVLEDGRVIVVAEGKVKEIREKEEPKEPEEPIEPEEPKEPEEPIEPEVPAYDAKAEIDALNSRIDDLEAKLAEAIVKIAELAASPAASPAAEEFDNVKINKNDKWQRIASAR